MKCVLLNVFLCVYISTIVPRRKKMTLNMTNNKPRYNIALFKRGILTLQCFCCCEWCFGREVRGSFHKADQSVSVSSLGSESLDRAQVCALGKTVAQ